MKRPLFAFVLFLAATALVDAQSPSKCLRKLESEPRKFDVCRKKECFIFLKERPFVFLDEEALKAKSDQGGLPFPCVDYSVYSSTVEGTFFDLLGKMRAVLPDPYCVWGGPDCTFDTMVQFINGSVANEGGAYRWIAGGLLFVLPKRIEPNLIPSASLLEDQLRVIGPPTENGSWLEAWRMIWRPFTTGAWGVIFGFITLIVGVRVWMADRFSRGEQQNSLSPGHVGPSSTPTNYCINFGRCYRWYKRVWGQFWSFGDTQEVAHQEDPDQEDRQRQGCEKKKWERRNLCWFIIFHFYVGIILILWEVVIAVLVFEERNTGLAVDPKINQYAMYKDTTQEYHFMQMYRINTTKGHDWKRYKSMDLVYNALLNDSGELRKVEYTLMYSVFNRFQMRFRPELCDKLRVYDDVPPTLVEGREPPRISGMWLYSGNIEQKRRNEIDQEIVRRKIWDVTRLVNSYAGDKLDERCESKSRRIGMKLLFLLGMAPGSMLLVLVCMLRPWKAIVRWIRKCFGLQEAPAGQYPVDTMPNSM